MAFKKADSATGIHIDPLKKSMVTLRMIGLTGMFYNAMSVKAKRSLLIGGGKKTAAEKKVLKHNPEEEYRDSVYSVLTGPTLLGFPAGGVKKAMSTAALETPGVTKTSVNRLVYLPQEMIPIWGKPYLRCDVVRSADLAKTPDIRTRAFLPEWCAEVKIAYIGETLTLQSIISLLANAGIVCGLGDYRQEKGAGSYGTFEVFGDEMGARQKDWDRIVSQGRAVQEAALKDPEPANAETEQLMQIINDERARRG